MNQTNQLENVDNINKAENIPTPSVDKNMVSDNQTLELLAEKPTIAIERLEVGKLQVRKEIRTKQIQLPITLKQEVLIIDHVANQQLAAALPDTKLHSQDPNNSSDWYAWVKIDNQTSVPSAKIMVNGQAHELQQPLEIVISQEFAHVQIQTLLAETVRLSTTTEESVQSIPVELRHEELVTNQVNYDTPQVLYREEVAPTEDPNAVHKATGSKK